MSIKLAPGAYMPAHNKRVFAEMVSRGITAARVLAGPTID